VAIFSNLSGMWNALPIALGQVRVLTRLEGVGLSAALLPKKPDYFRMETS
jgi:hypothetical protein